MEYDKVKVRQPVDLRKLAEWAGTTVDDIQDLNPELRRWTTPVPRPGGEAYEIKVPKGGGAALESRLAELSPADTAALKWYTVKRGDTLTTIAKKLRVNRVDLADANYLSARSVVTPGQNLVIPVEPSRLLARGPESDVAGGSQPRRRGRGQAGSAEVDARGTGRHRQGDLRSQAGRHIVLVGRALPHDRGVHQGVERVEERPAHAGRAADHPGAAQQRTGAALTGRRSS